jgi:hypothetical protein
MNKAILILGFILLFCFTANAIVQIDDFNKVVSHASASAMNETQYSLIHSSGTANYLVYNKVLYHKSNLSVAYTPANITNGYASVNSYFYRLSSNGLYLQKYNLTSGALINTSANLYGGIVTDVTFRLANILYPTEAQGGLMAFVHEGVTISYDHLYVMQYTGGSTDTGGHCSTANGANWLGYNTGMLGFDSAYIYVYEAHGHTPHQSNFFKLDWDCNLITSTWMNSTNGYPSKYNTPMPTNVYYEAGEDFFIGVLVNDDSYLGNPYYLQTFQDNGYGIDNKNLTTAYGFIPNTSSIAYEHKCTYDNDNNYYYCLVYNNSDVEDIFLAKTEIDTEGRIGDTEMLSIFDYFNTPGVDEYDYTRAMIWYNREDESIYLQLHDTIDGYYDVFNATTTYINDTYGLACNNDYSLCYDAGSTCFDNTNFYTGNDASNWVCNSTSYYYGLNCLNTLNYCSGGCINTIAENPYGIEYYHGTCLSSNCSNECNVLGQRYSNTYTTIQYCNVSSTGCLEWSQSTCGIGEYSENGLCKTKNYTEASITKIDFSFNPYTSVNIYGGVYGCTKLECTYNDITGIFNCPEDTCGYAEAKNPNLQSVNYDSSTQTLTVNAKKCSGSVGTFELRIQAQGDDLNASSVIGVDCDYKETITEEELNKTLSMQGYQVAKLTGNNNYYNPNIGLTNKEEFSLLFNDTAVFWINITDNANILNLLYVVVNQTNNEYSLRRNNASGTILVTDSFSQDIGRLNIMFYHDFSSQETNFIVYAYSTLNQLLGINGIVMQSYDSTLATTPDSLNLNVISGELFASKIARIQMSSGIPSYYKNYYVEGITDFRTQYELTGCTYLQDGTYKARIYVSEEFLGQFFSYEDLIINKNTITTCGTGNTQTISIFDKIGVQTKLILGFLIPMIALLIFVSIGITNNDDSTQRMLIFFGAFLFVAGLIIFAVLTWIPVWIMIVSSLIASMLVGLFFIRKTQGD